MKSDEFLRRRGWSRVMGGMWARVDCGTQLECSPATEDEAVRLQVHEDRECASFVAEYRDRALTGTVTPAGLLQLSKRAMAVLGVRDGGTVIVVEYDPRDGELPGGFVIMSAVDGNRFLRRAT